MTAKKSLASYRYKFVTNQYDQHTGKLLRSRRFEEKGWGEKLRNMIYDIHVGSILGLPEKNAPATGKKDLKKNLVWFTPDQAFIRCKKETGAQFINSTFVK